jgi:hypothetical protein
MHVSQDQCGHQEFWWVDASLTKKYHLTLEPMEV